MSPHRIADSLTVTWARIADEQPWLPLAVVTGPVIATATAIWGSAFVVVFGWFTLCMLWDWVLGAQVAVQRSHYLTRLGVLDEHAREDMGAFSFREARLGFAGKINLGTTLLIFGAVEGVIMSWLGNPHLVAADAVLPIDVISDGHHAISGAVVVGAAALQELRSCERNRRTLGGRPIPLFSAAIDWLDAAAARLVPYGEGRELEDVETLAEWFDRARADLEPLGEEEQGDATP